MTSIVFVHLGPNPAPTLLHYAALCEIRNPECERFLITDNIGRFSDFPGTLIEYSPKSRSKVVDKFLKRNREYMGMSGGYWLYTTERLFSLEILGNFIGYEKPFIHIESDVMLLMNNDDLDLLKTKCLTTAVPRHSEDRGIASFLYSPNLNTYTKTLEEFANILIKDKSINNDMQLLGTALNNGIIQELPSDVSSAWIDNQGQKVIFDGMSFGQYLFGLDPIHTNGKIVSGKTFPWYKVDLANTIWEISSENNSKNQSVYFNIKGENIRLLNLHIHSKRLLPNVSKNDLIWINALREANGEKIRTESEHIPDLIHSQRISIINRFRIARKNKLLMKIGKRKILHLILSVKKNFN